MKRVALLVLALLLLGAACSRTTSAAAATINGNAISTQDLVDELNAISANPDYITSLQSGGPTNGLTVVGTTPGSFDAAFVSQVLLRQMDYALIRAEVTKRHVPISDACRLEAKNDTLSNLGQQDVKAGQALFDKFPKRYQDLLVQRYAEVLTLEAAVGGQTCGQSIDAQSYYNSHQSDFTKLCVSLIAVTDPAQADSIVAQARGGADFAALVQQYSVDPTSKATDGAIGCRLPSEFNPTVAGLLTAAKTGDVLDPIPGQNGASILKLTDRQQASFDEVRQQAEQLAQSSATDAFGSWLQDARSKAQVTVDARYGTFDPSRYQINPPTIDLSSSSQSGSSSSSTGSP